MNNSDGTRWPPLEAGYTDEFGHIEPEVYEVAGALWRAWGERYARSHIDDAHLGLELMLKAAAGVSKVYAGSADHIDNLTAYLSTSYKRLVLKEMARRNAHGASGDENTEPPAGGNPVKDLERKILLEQVIRRMDAWMRETFDLRVLGNTFEEIAEMRGEDAHVMRTKFSKNLDKLRRRIEDEEQSGKQKAGEAGDATDEVVE